MGLPEIGYGGFRHVYAFKLSLSYLQIIEVIAYISKKIVITHIFTIFLLVIKHKINIKKLCVS